MYKALEQRMSVEKVGSNFQNNYLSLKYLKNWTSIKASSNFFKTKLKKNRNFIAIFKR